MRRRLGDLEVSVRRGWGDPGGRDEEGDRLAEGSEMRRGWACPCFYLSKNLSSDKGDGDQLAFLSLDPQKVETLWPWTLQRC